MKQPLYPQSLQVNYPGQTVSEEEARTTDSGTFRAIEMEWGTGIIRETVANGFIFSYQEWVLPRANRVSFTSEKGGGILHVVLAGNLHFALPDGEELHLTAGTGTIGLYPAGQAQTLQMGAGAHQHLQIALSAPLFAYLAKTLMENESDKRAEPTGLWFYPFPVPLSRRTGQLLPAIQKEMERVQSDLLSLNRLGVQVLEHFRDDALRLQRRQTWEAKKTLKLEELESYINDHLDTEDRPLLRVATLAKKLRLSRYAFVSLFRQRFGQPPAAFIRGRRLETALRWLQQGQSPGSIYSAVGFEDFAAFTKSFTRLYGNPPSHYLKRE